MYFNDFSKYFDEKVHNNGTFGKAEVGGNGYLCMQKIKKPRKMKLHLTKNIPGALLSAALLFPLNGSAQLSSNPDKFLGNITTRGQVDYGNEKFYQLWNQITPENETKWQSIEGNSRGSFNWSGADRSANYAKQHGFPFKFHTLIWGAQYPGWMDNLSTAEQYKAIVEWFDAVKKHYPDLEVIDVVNEAVAGHQPAPYRAALGGEGRTGYDWIIKAFELAHERWPNAILVYNDYNTFQWQIDQFIALVQALRDNGAPIDAYGCQSHDLTDMNLSAFKSAMTKIQNALKMPMYSTEYDIGTTDDAKQLQRYKEQIPVMWEADYCAGITFWGYIYGATWTTDGNSGIIRNGKDRPAMTWLREYMASDAAKNAKSPFPGFKKEASIYIRPVTQKVAKNDTMPIYVRASMRTKEIEKVELYVNNVLDTIMTEAPYLAKHVPTTTGTKTVKAVVTTTDGNMYERTARFTVLSSTAKRQPFKGEVPQLPGVVEAENFDEGADGVSFHDTDNTKQGDKTYRTDAAGVDIVKVGDDGFGIGYTKDGEWLQYTVDVKEAGLYSVDLDVAAEKEGLFHLVENHLGDMKFLTDFITVPSTGSANDYKNVHLRLTVPLEAGRQVIGFCIDKGGFSFDKMTFTPLVLDNTIANSVKCSPTTVNLDDATTITVTASSKTSTIDHVNVYANDMHVATLTEAPYQTEFVPTAKGSWVITSIATDAEGKESKVAKAKLKVNGKRVPYKGLIELPGVIEAENFDGGGEGLSFHDTDDQDQGDAKYRTDNEGVDLVKGNGGTAIGYTAKGEWLEYSVNVKEAGTYMLNATVSSGVSGSYFTVSLKRGSNMTSLCRVNVPQTGNSNWDTYKVVTIDRLTVKLPEGECILRINIGQDQCNIDKLELKLAVDTGISQQLADEAETDAPAYNLSGQKVSPDYKGLVIRNGKKILKK